MLKIIRKQWFILAILTGACFGYKFNLELKSISNYTIYVIPPVLFLMSLNLDWHILSKAFKNRKAIFLTLFLSFLVMPLIGFLLGKIFLSQEAELFKGIIVAVAAGGTIGSSIIWTKVSGGNYALSLILSIMITLLSAFFSPLIILIYLGKSIHLPLVSMITNLLLITFFPVILAQVLKAYIDFSRLKPFTTPLSQILIIVMVSGTMAKAADLLTARMIFLAVPIVVFLNTIMMIISYFGSQKLGFNRRDAIAISFASSQITLSTSVFIALHYFEAITVLPALIYHLSQQILSVFFAEFFKKQKMEVLPKKVTLKVSI